LFSYGSKPFAAKRRYGILYTPRIARLRWIATAGKQPMSRIRIVVAAVSAALHQMQAVRLPPQTLLWCERGDDFLEARIAAQRIPQRAQAQVAISVFAPEFW